MGTMYTPCFFRVTALLLIMLAVCAAPPADAQMGGYPTAATVLASRATVSRDRHVATTGTGISDAAYALLTERAMANRESFYVYQNADSGSNHAFPSGFFGTTHKIHLDTACVDDPNSVNGCATDPNRLDRTRGTVLRIAFDPLNPGEFAGVNIEEPENWGSTRVGRGYDLSGTTQVVFEVRTPTPSGIKVQFGVQDKTTAFIDIPHSWTTMSMPFSTLNLAPQDVTDVHILFTVVTNDANAPNGGTVLLDNIRFEPVPTSQRTALSFPLSTQTFGVVPLQNPAPGRVPLPSDQILRNLTTTYESALTILALLARGTDQDVSNACTIADAFHYALHHDNHGDALPPAPDGAIGLHNAYSSGDLALFNDQGPAAGLQGDVRLAGFSASTMLCGSSGFCLLLDGATGGNNAFAILALVAASKRCPNASGLRDDARTIGRWIAGNLTDTTGTGFGGYFLGYPDEGMVPKFLIKGKSVENNADIFAAFTALAAVAGDTAEAAQWTARANVAGDFVMQMFDPVSDCFYAGTTPRSTGSDPNAPQRGDDVLDTRPFLDAQTFTTLALAMAPRYRSQIDWRRPVQCALQRFAQTITVAGQVFRGFNIVEMPTDGPRGIAWEFTAQAVVAMRLVDRLYQSAQFTQDADFYRDQIGQAQTIAPFGDTQGIVASTLQDGDSLPPLEQCLSTPFQCIPQRVGLAATTWAIFADQNINPLAGCSPCGDVNASGAVTPRDALLAFQFFLELATPTPCQFDAADVDVNGVITPADALAIFKKFLGLGSGIALCL